MSTLPLLVLLTSSFAPLPSTHEGPEVEGDWIGPVAGLPLAQTPPTPRPHPFEEGDRPWRLTPYSIVDLSGNFEGGVKRGVALRTLTGLTGELDLDASLGWTGATLFADLQWIAGDDGSALVGDLQGFSNIDYPEDRFQLSEIWYEQRFAAPHLRLKLAGKVDANSEFAYVDAGAEFVHSSAGLSPSLHPLPTYPDPAFGANLFVEEVDGFSAGFGVYDGAAASGFRTGSLGPATVFGPPADLFAVGEVGYRWESGHVGVGGWFHSAEFERWDGGLDRGTEGGYLVAEGRLWRENPGDPQDPQGLELWTHLGLADERIAEVGPHASLGVLGRGLFHGRDEDLTGFGVHSARLSNEPGAGFTADHETAFELFHSIQLLPELRIQPDLQYIVDPGGQGLENAFVGTLRLAFEL